MVKLALIRHGHTAWNRAGRIQGRTDIPLDPEAEAHLAQLALPDPWQSAALVSSPLVRARRTGQLISGKDPVLVPALTEMDWGQWEGEKGALLLENPETDYRHIEDWGWSYRPPGGESPDDVRARLLPWIESLAEDTVAVCHIGIMRVLMAQASGWGFVGPAPFRVKRDRLFVLEITPSGWSLAAEPVRLLARSK